jgi:hypothetical protein
MSLLFYYYLRHVNVVGPLFTMHAMYEMCDEKTTNEQMREIGTTMVVHVNQFAKKLMVRAKN